MGATRHGASFRGGYKKGRERSLRMQCSKPSLAKRVKVAAVVRTMAG